MTPHEIYLTTMTSAYATLHSQPGGFGTAAGGGPPSPRKPGNKKVGRAQEAEEDVSQIAADTLKAIRRSAKNQRKREAKLQKARDTLAERQPSVRSEAKQSDIEMDEIEEPERQVLQLMLTPSPLPVNFAFIRRRFPNA